MSVVVPQFLYSVQGVRGAYGVLQCLMVSVVLSLFLLFFRAVSYGVCCSLTVFTVF